MSRRDGDFGSLPEAKSLKLGTFASLRGISLSKKIRKMNWK